MAIFELPSLQSKLAILHGIYVHIGKVPISFFMLMVFKINIARASNICIRIYPVQNLVLVKVHVCEGLVTVSRLVH